MIEIRSKGNLAKRLNELANLRDVQNAVKLNATEMHRKASRRVPVDTGHLKRSLTIDFSDGGLTGRVSTDVEYAGCNNVARSIINALELVKIGRKLMELICCRGWNIV